MDLTQKYIDKSRGAVEIQALWLPQDGDYYYGPPCMPGCGYGVGELDDSVNIIRNVTTIDDNGDDVRITNTQWTMFSMDLGDWWSGDIPRDSCTWLPKQDQCQYMAMPKNELGNLRSTWGLHNDFTRWYEEESLRVDDDSPNNAMGWTYEQLWLGYVMFLKFNKYWDETIWRRAINDERF